MRKLPVWGKSKTFWIYQICIIVFLLCVTGCIFDDSSKKPDIKLARFEIIETELGMTSYDSPYILITVKNIGNAIGYNVSCDVHALNDSNVIIDTGSAYFAGLEDIKPEQMAQDDAIFFDLKSHDDYVTLDYNLSWLTRN